MTDKIVIKLKFVRETIRSTLIFSYRNTGTNQLKYITFHWNKSKQRYDIERSDSMGVPVDNTLTPTKIPSNIIFMIEEPQYVYSINAKRFKEFLATEGIRVQISY